MRRTTCSACSADELHQILDLGMSPIADAYTDTFNETSPTYPLQLAVCTSCWLVQLLDVLPQDVLFGTGYSFYSSASPPLSRYHEKYAQYVLGQYRHLAECGVVEIGCNDGDMLRHFKDYPSVGVDPAGGPVKAARERGLNVINEPFDVTVANEYISMRGNAGIVIANHVLAHVESVSDVLEGIATLLHEYGVAFIEVQYLPDLLTNNAFDLVYHEHRNFFSLTSLIIAARQHGLHLQTAEYTNRQGGSLRATLTRQPSRVTPWMLDAELWLQDISAYAGLQGRAERIRIRLLELLMDEIDRGRQLIGYGAPAKATTLLNFCGITDGNWLDFVIDTTPAKQGRYVPGTGIPILGPEAATITPENTALLLAWNYASQIIRNNPECTRWVVPIPAPTII